MHNIEHRGARSRRSEWGRDGVSGLLLGSLLALAPESHASAEGCTTQLEVWVLRPTSVMPADATDPDGDEWREDDAGLIAGGPDSVAISTGWVTVGFWRPGEGPEAP
jgi:hypothetical protein